MKRAESGFTLIGLMVLSIALAIGTIGFMQGPCRCASNNPEASAQASLRTVRTVSEQYRDRFAAYPTDLAELAANGYVYSALGTGLQSGYTFVLVGTTTTWTCTANPTTASDEGRYFFVDESGVIRWAVGVAASVSSPPIQ
ncbi:MAG TPA: type II secretion system protein [Planctomycetes bacterium]|nr:type II secretion system protein [Planctomycetota bacterium]